MEVLETELSLADRDLQLNKLQQEITQKKQLLLEKYYRLKTMKDANVYIENVKMDYQQYHQKLLEDKKKQEAALNNLTKYLADLMKVDKMAGQVSEEIKRDNASILQEINKLKGEINNLLSDRGR